MLYPAEVERHFRAPANVAPLSPAPYRSFRGEAGVQDLGTRVLFEVEVDGAVVRRIAFRAYGSPYVIAACSRTTELLTGVPVQALNEFDPLPLAAQLETPPEKLGSLLILQDALRNCFRDWDTTQPAGAR
jgi:NifU-like protein involved in Fe-S cluster formation